MNLLEIRSLTVRYGGVVAVDNVDLDVASGEIVGLIGPNGAGKTSLVDAITGFTPCVGDVRFDGRSMAGLRPHKRVKPGMSRTFQTLELFEDMTVEENLSVAASSVRWWSVVTDMIAPRSSKATNERIADALSAVGLVDRADLLPSQLSNGDRKLIAVARALVSAPRCVILDEPASGLNSSESQQLGKVLRRLVDGGLTMLLIDHDMELMLSVSDRVYVLDFGRIISEGTPRAIREDSNVIAAYLGHGEARHD